MYPSTMHVGLCFTIHNDTFNNAYIVVKRVQSTLCIEKRKQNSVSTTTAVWTNTRATSTGATIASVHFTFAINWFNSVIVKKYDLVPSPRM